ncbi:2OG-Fe(II) oxygenase family protein [Novosphingobium mangrovi (ex Huang et al. 2023)]|uniref:Tetratricopeptide repeat protein n=1 Tax=Novosphingobium mangrovi (ex Huang et al. 2023) TaxID=2976432 RepID=A0ABT2I4D6_9SPHN|nr:tetratricopeptide repeat protein [Novosphingobium mangrovi (ex Huang et al. 2023)]MCT2399671.1 tetratricopeptide repeat protein [Novosphingobium mangrovi (ex Huang et al. 2023)]
MSDTPPDLAALAERALGSGDEEQAERRLSDWLRSHPGDATVLHWAAMLRRALDRRDDAIAALEQALRLVPGNPGLVHALAHVTLEAGRPASRLFEQAVQLSPAKAEIRLGLASARFAEGDKERALSELDAMLAANHGWDEGHRQFAQLSALMGRGEEALATIERTLQHYPEADRLRVLGINLLMEAERHAEALEATRQAIALRGAHAAYRLPQAAALDELGRSEEAKVIFEPMGAPADAGHAVWRARHWLRTGEPSRAAAEVEPWLAATGAEGVWPYAALAWRLTGDPRAEWLDGQAGLHKVVDLDPEEIGLEPLRALLRRLHAGSGRFLDQSVRGGTQTEGALLARTEPEIARVREVLRREVASFMAQLPPSDAAHPMLSQVRVQRPRFAGSWSVRLGEAGFHTAHHHPQGWISSALYVSVPEGLGEEEGCLDLGGAPGELGLTIAPRRTVEPRPARLVLFPSWMWHGTRPFDAGERMTIAFDIARA